MKLQVSEEHLRQIGALLNDPHRPLKERFRALFTLKNIEGGVSYISEGFRDKSALLLHELAYCLGQTQDPAAIPVLARVLEDTQMETITRHEAGEALGALGYQQGVATLQKYENDPNPIIAQTCQLSLERLRFIETPEFVSLQEELRQLPYQSIDPALPFPKGSKGIEELRDILLDVKQSIWNRYRALFSLRNLGTLNAVRILGEALSCPSSALFRHEVAYVFGQMQNKGSIPFLQRCLEDKNELAMVRHECAEALGSIATEECTRILEQFVDDPEDIVRESCEVALDMCEYENSTEFQYANTLTKLTQVHSNCRNCNYPNTDIKRGEVPLDKIAWNIEFSNYAPADYEKLNLEGKPWADPKIPKDSFDPKFNEIDGCVNRRSYEGTYEVIDGIPRNPHGRTGITGRGYLGRYGPNHAADPVVTRWKRDAQGKQIMDKTTSMPIAEFVGIRRKDNGQWAIPGGMVDPGETVSATLKREFMEEAMNNLKNKGITVQQRNKINEFFRQGTEIYKGYVDDPRNTDNAWLETVVINFHDDKGDLVGNWSFQAGSDAREVRWIPLHSEIKLYASHADFLAQVAAKIKAHW
ncbi:deoxyhypusine hydroxylase-like [Tropilaelaps mercedesae]|uniref:Deoxyhypusine hydroxylase n=1 Tax=Tropilaelaps mercedesae TaxID=418985 RepID=A0A1V9XNI5_9ACAR|nr:deoxyhypusine hydroxylase-like [Tropilaelaps mercedesae]